MRDKVRLLVISNATGISAGRKTLTYDRFARRFGGYGQKFDTRLALLPEESASRPSSGLPSGITPIWLPAYHSRGEFVHRLPRMVRALWKATKEAEAILICIPLLHGLPALLIGLILRRPVFVLMIGSWVAAGRPRVQGGGASSQARRLMAALASNAFGFLASTLLVHGNADQELIAPLRSKAIRVVESTLSTEDISVLDPSAAPDLKILCVGRLVATKRYDVALESLKLLRDRGKAATLTLLGEGPERLALERLAQQLSMDSFVTFEGFVDDRNELARRYRESFALLLPSETEGLSLAVMEAMAAGTPVISTGAGGMQSFLESGTDSIVLEAPYPEKFADAVELLISQPERRLKMVEAAQEKVRMFTHEEWVDKLDSIVRQRLGVA